MRKPVEPCARPRWEWRPQGGARLFAVDGTEFSFVARLTRVEVERLLTLQELDAVRVECGGGVTAWVGAAGAQGLWLEVEPDLDDVDGWRPPPHAPGALPYRAELWRTNAGRHALLFTDE